MSNVWQIAAGEAGRRYDDLFLEHDVMLCGPGDFDEYDEATYCLAVGAGDCSKSEFHLVRRFHDEVKPNDFVLLRCGRDLVSLGIAHEEGYRYENRFDDVWGWDLQHCRRVIWQRQLDDEIRQIQAETPPFAGRRQIPTFTRVTDSAVLNPIKHLFPKCTTRPLKDLPPPPSAVLSSEKLGQALFAKGLSYNVVDKLQIVLDKQRALLAWYRKYGPTAGRPTEHEVVAHMVIPPLLALGWSEQFLAVEWHRIDLAVFRGTPTDKESCKLICEAKSMGHGLQNVLDQAIQYVQHVPLPQCDKILLSNGGTFYLYRKRNGKWGEHPEGYFNVLLMRERHVCPSGTNAVETMIDLTPAYIDR